MTLKRILNAIMLIGLGFMGGALTQAAADMEADTKARMEYCVPLYDQGTEGPGVERVQCDPVGGAR